MIDKLTKLLDHLEIIAALEKRRDALVKAFTLMRRAEAELYRSGYEADAITKNVVAEMSANLIDISDKNEEIIQGVNRQQIIEMKAMFHCLISYFDKDFMYSWACLFEMKQEYAYDDEGGHIPYFMLSPKGELPKYAKVCEDDQYSYLHFDEANDFRKSLIQQNGKIQHLIELHAIRDETAWDVAVRDYFKSLMSLVFVTIQNSGAVNPVTEHVSFNNCDSLEEFISRMETAEYRHNDDRFMTVRELFTPV